MTASLEGMCLPAELLARVAHYVPRPADLKSLCMTSKTLRDAALPKLYKRVVLRPKVTPGWPNLQFGRGLLNTRNGGLHHIRRLSCYGAGPDDHTLEASCVRSLLQFLPRNGLTHLYVTNAVINILKVDGKLLSISGFGNMKIDQVTLVTLLTQQNKLKYLHLGPLQFDLTSLLEAKVFGDQVWAHLEELCVPGRIDREQDLIAYRHIIQNAPQLSNLNLWSPYQGTPPTRLESTVSEESPIFRILFPPRLVDSTSCCPLRLHKLDLDGVCLRAVKSRFLQIFDVCTLRSLRIAQCTGWKKLLPVLAETFAKHGSSLRTLHVEVAVLNRKPIENLLRSVKHLRTVRLMGRGCDGAIALDVLEQHMETLKELVLAHSYDKASIDDDGTLRLYKMVATQFPALKRLGLALPTVHLREASTEQLSHYNSVLGSLGAIPSIELLRVFSWPAMPHDSFAQIKGQQGLFKEPNRALYEEALNEFMATHLSEAFTSTGTLNNGTPIVCFSSLEKDVAPGEVAVTLPSVCFVPCKQLDIFGNARLKASRLSLAEAKYINDHHSSFKWIPRP